MDRVRYLLNERVFTVRLVLGIMIINFDIGPLWLRGWTTLVGIYLLLSTFWNEPHDRA